MTLSGVVVQKVLHWVLPLTCYHCSEDLPEGVNDPLCARCLKAAGPYEGLTCVRCAVPLKYGGAHCWKCRTLPHGSLSLLRTVTLFGPEVRAVIHAFKYESRKHLAAPIGDWMVEAFLRNPEIQGAHAIVPVPLHPSRLRERGFNQAEELAERLAEKAGVPVRSLLIRRKATKAQADLDKEERLANVEEAFFAQRGAKMKGKTVLLIDDVATTGATLEACALALKRIGIRTVNALVVARQAKPSG